MRALAPAALALLLAHVASAQDAVRIGTPSGVGPYTVPITVSDVAGTPLGVDRPAGEKLQAFAVTVRFTPASAVASASFSRIGLLASRSPLFETAAAATGTVTWVGSFAETGGAIPFVPGGSDPILALQVALVPGRTVSVSLDAATTTLSNQGGTVSETTGDSTLVLGPAVSLGGVDTVPIPALSPFGLAALAAALAAAGAVRLRRS